MAPCARRSSSAVVPACLAAVSAAVLVSSASRQLLFCGSPAASAVAAARESAVARQAGFDSAPPKASKAKGKTSLSEEQLREDHGDAWEMVDQVLRGKKAQSPEAIMRARFTAVKYKDCAFLAATEIDEQADRKQRTEGWKEVLGLKEKDPISNLLSFGGKSDIESLRSVRSFEVVSTLDDDVEFKIRCADGKVLYEKSTFKKDAKWGYVYTGESEFGKWE